MNEVTVYRGFAPQNVNELQAVAAIIARAKLFGDKGRDEDKVACIIMRGLELGIGPMAAMSGIDANNGGMELRAHLMAAQIRKSNVYDYKVTKSDSKGCEIQFFRVTEEGNILLGTSKFSEEDAKRAKLFNKASYAQHPEDMYYNRAMSKGARKFCPDAFNGPVYGIGEIAEQQEAPAAVVVESAISVDKPDENIIKLVDSQFEQDLASLKLEDELNEQMLTKVKEGLKKFYEEKGARNAAWQSVGVSAKNPTVTKKHVIALANNLYQAGILK